MNVEDFRVVFLAGSFILILIIVMPTLALFINLPSNTEKFSAIWLLGPGHKAENYPSNVNVSEIYRVYLGVENHLGNSVYYRVYLKLRNQTQPLPVNSNSTPSPLTPLYEFNFFSKHEELWETSVNFSVLNVEDANNTMIMKNISINDVNISVNSLSTFDSSRNGFYYQLFFELWLYNVVAQSFQYHNRFAGIWLNMTL